MISQPSFMYSLITRSQSAPPAMFSTLKVSTFSQFSSRYSLAFSWV